MESRLSKPDSAFDSTGTPSTGRVVIDAAMPGRCAAPPAPARITFSPRPAALHGDLDPPAENLLLRASLTQMQARIEELERLIDIDGLTAIPNRRRFVAELERTVVRTGRHGTPSSVVFIDLNGLRSINETKGYLAGDAAIIHVAKLLSGLIR